MGEVTYQAFRPTKKDDYRLSVYDGDQIGAREAWSHYTSVLEMKSVGVKTVTETECGQLQLPVIFDQIPFLEHASVDFSGHSKSQIERKADSLKQFAIQRGWQFQEP